MCHYSTNGIELHLRMYCGVLGEHPWVLKYVTTLSHMGAALGRYRSLVKDGSWAVHLTLGWNWGGWPTFQVWILCTVKHAKWCKWLETSWAQHLLIVKGSLRTSQISHLLLYPSLWLLVPGLSSQFCHYFLYNLLLMSAVVGNIFEKRLQDFVSFGNPW